MRLLLSILGAAVTVVNGQGRSGDLGFGVLRGHVRDEKERSLSAVKVRAISRRSDETLDEVRTDESGNYEFPKLPAGRYTLSFFSSEHQSATLTVVEVRRNETTQVKDVVMIRAKPFAVVAGSTFNQDGFVLAGVRLILERVPFASEPISPLKMEQHSNASGEFAFRLAPEKSRYRITASAPGYEIATAAVDIEGAERRNTALRLQPKR